LISTEPEFRGFEEEVARLWTPSVGSYMRPTNAPFGKAEAARGAEVAVVTGKDFEGIERDWEVSLYETAGGMRRVWEHGRYSLLFRSQQTAEERRAEEEWLRSVEAKSDFIIPQIESQLGLPPEEDSE
jgi:hypothetical protein